MAASLSFPDRRLRPIPCALGSIGPVSPVLDQRSRIVQTDLFSLVDQPLQLGPLSFGNCTLIILIKQIGYSRLRYRIQLQKTQIGFFQRNQFAQVDPQNEAESLYNLKINLLNCL